MKEFDICFRKKIARKYHTIFCCLYNGRSIRTESKVIKKTPRNIFTKKKMIIFKVPSFKCYAMVPLISFSKQVEKHFSGNCFKKPRTAEISSESSVPSQKKTKIA